MQALEELPRASADRTRGSVASMHRKKRSVDARANAGTLNTGWYGCGSLFSAHMPTKQVSAAPSTVVSNVTGMNCGQLWNGRPPMFIG